MLPKAIPFDLIDGFSISLVLQKLDIQSFPEKRPELLTLAGRSYKVCRQLKGHFFTINAPRPLILPKKNKIKNIYIFQAFLGRFSLSLLSLISLPNKSKHIKTPSNTLDSHLISTIFKVMFLHPIFLSFVPYLGFEV